MKVRVEETFFKDENGRVDLDKSLVFCGHLAGICYDREGLEHIKLEPMDKTQKRIDLTKNNGHHSVYDHVFITFDIIGVPKILAMVLNNEHQYTTSEKSARYTPVEKVEGSIITDKEAELYHKWLEIFKVKIKNLYGDIYNDSKITKLAQENARYLVTVFMPTTFAYTTSLRQINYIVSWMQKYINEHEQSNGFEHKLAESMKLFIECVESLNVLDEGLLKNEKNRSISLFTTNVDQKEEHFGEVYATSYRGSFAQLAQAQRHRTINYSMELCEEKSYFIPPILYDEPALVDEWLRDIESVKEVNPQGELVKIYERGIYENFLLKCQERLCSAAQLEIANQTKETLSRYFKVLKVSGSYLTEDLERYTHGARCTFPCYECSSRCNFKEGINLTRKI